MILWAPYEKSKSLGSRGLWCPGRSHSGIDSVGERWAQLISSHNKSWMHKNDQNSPWDLEHLRYLSIECKQTLTKAWSKEPLVLSLLGDGLAWRKAHKNLWSNRLLLGNPGKEIPLSTYLYFLDDWAKVIFVPIWVSWTVGHITTFACLICFADLCGCCDQDYWHPPDGSKSLASYKRAWDTSVAKGWCKAPTRCEMAPCRDGYLHWQICYSIATHAFSI